jgi:hypothetical protein
MSDPAQAARAVAAAQAVARRAGVACDDAVVLPGGSNTLVHLRPAALVARVMTGTALLHDDVERWLTREVEVGAYLGARGLAVAPSASVAPGPHHVDGLWMTMWAFAEHDRARPLPSPAALGRSLRALHDALAGYPGRLPPLSEVRDWLDRLLAGLRPGAGGLSTQQRDALRGELHALTPTVFAGPLPAQAIHGDASLTNLLPVAGGLLWNDLEDVCAGPVHWDVAGLVEEVRVRGLGEPFAAAFLEAYDGPGLDELEPFLAAHRVYAAVWRAFSAQRRAEAADGRR